MACLFRGLAPMLYKRSGIGRKGAETQRRKPQLDSLEQRVGILGEFDAPIPLSFL